MKSAIFLNGSSLGSAGRAACLCLCWLALLLGLPQAVCAAETLVPGQGWKGPWESVERVGAAEASGGEATAIARWDVVPHQSFDGIFEVGVIAFHINGIDRVEFSVENGPRVAVREMTLNPRTGAWEYWVALDAARFRDEQEGPIEVRAVVYPATAGVPRVLSNGSATQVDSGDGSLTLVVDKGGLKHPRAWVSTQGDDQQGDGTREKPYRTIDRAIAATAPISVRPWEPDKSGVLDGTTIYLEEGAHTAPTKGYYHMRRWCTISGAEDADPNKVVLTGRAGGRCNIQLLRFRRLTWKPSADGSLVHAQHKGGRVWLDHMHGIGGGRLTYGATWVQNADSYWTTVSVQDFKQGVQTWAGDVMLARDVHVLRCAEDSFRANKMLVNCSVHDVNAKGIQGPHPHPDVVQMEYARNFIIFNLKATDVRSQGIYIRGEDWALVNVFIQQAEGSKYLWQVDKIPHVRHCLLWHCGTVNQAFLWRTGSGTKACRDISVRNSAWTSMGCGKDSQGEETDCRHLAEKVLTVDNNHFGSAPFAQGTRATTGEEGFVKGPDGAWGLAPGSPLLDRADEPLVACDMNGEPRSSPTAIGPFEAPPTP